MTNEIYTFDVLKYCVPLPINEQDRQLKYELQSELRMWLKENVVPYEYRFRSYICELRFYNAEYAMAFKLRWM